MTDAMFVDPPKPIVISLPISSLPFLALSILLPFPLFASLHRYLIPPCLSFFSLCVLSLSLSYYLRLPFLLHFPFLFLSSYLTFSPFLSLSLFFSVHVLPYSFLILFLSISPLHAFTFLTLLPSPTLCMPSSPSLRLSFVPSSSTCHPSEQKYDCQWKKILNMLINFSPEEREKSVKILYEVNSVMI